MLGLAIGDALGGPAEGKSRATINERFGRITDFLNDAQQGSDDTEYALFNARLLLLHGKKLDVQVFVHAWKQEIENPANAYKGVGFSEMLALRNLKAGLLPPGSGEHCHAWSDGLAMRVAPFGIVCAGRPEEAAELAGLDGSVTHAGEGIASGKAVAAAIAAAMAGLDLNAILASARNVIPEDCWTRRAIDRAVDAGTKADNVWSAHPLLERAVVFPGYYWSDLAPEATALAFGLLAAARLRFRDAVLGAVNMGRDTDTIAAIAGAVAGASEGVEVLPQEWIQRVVTARGSCIDAVRGMKIDETADKLALLVSPSGGSHARS